MRRKIDDFYVGSESVVFSLLGEKDERVFRFCEIKIRDKRSGGAEDARDFKIGSKERSETKSRIFRRIFLVIGGFMSLINNNESKIFKGGEKGRTRADDDAGGGGKEKLFPDLMTFRFGLFGVN